jgi:hypothetical protein
VDNARYHRSQAELCLQIAELMSDPAAADLLREAAVRHFAESGKSDESRQRKVIRLNLPPLSPRQM